MRQVHSHQKNIAHLLKLFSNRSLFGQIGGQ